jgi:transposase
LIVKEIYAIIPQKGGVIVKQKNWIKLKSKEREQLKGLLSKGKENSRKLTRCRILLLSDAGDGDSAIMEALQVARNTIRKLRERYITEGLKSAINERPRSGAPSKITGKQKAKITALACSNAPEGRSRWSLRLLADKAVELKMIDNISHMDVGRILKKTKLNRI